MSENTVCQHFIDYVVCPVNFAWPCEGVRVARGPVLTKLGHVYSFNPSTPFFIVDSSRLATSTHFFGLVRILRRSLLIGHVWVIICASFERLLF